jgi:hypothetical protein
MGTWTLDKVAGWYSSLQIILVNFLTTFSIPLSQVKIFRCNLRSLIFKNNIGKPRN